MDVLRNRIRMLYAKSAWYQIVWGHKKVANEKAKKSQMKKEKEKRREEKEEKKRKKEKKR